MSAYNVTSLSMVAKFYVNELLMIFLDHLIGVRIKQRPNHLFDEADLFEGFLLERMEIDEIEDVVKVERDSDSVHQAVV